MMATQYVQDGEFIDHTPGSAVAAGQVVIATDRVFVAPRPIAANTLGVLQTRGVWRLPATAAETWTFGQKLYWDGGTGKLTNVAGALKVIGYANAAKATTVAEGDVLLGN
jgi:predicted RecA/RadA family phage recombinase